MPVRRTAIDYDKMLNRVLRAIERENISEENKELLRELYKYFYVKGLSKVRIARLLNILLIIAREHDLKSLEKQDIINIVYNLKMNNYSDDTIKLYIIAINHLLKYLGKQIDIEVSLNLNVRNAYLSFNDVLNIINLIDHIDYKAYTMFLYDTASRPSEALSVTMKDINIYEDHIEFHITGKTGDRKVYSVIFREQLENYINMRKIQKAKYLFDISYDYYTKKLLPRIKDILGLDALFPYMFRHSRITDLSNKLTEQQLKALCGWAPQSTMLKHYIKQEHVKIPIKKLSVGRI